MSVQACLSAFSRIRRYPRRLSLDALNHSALQNSLPRSFPGRGVSPALYSFVLLAEPTLFGVATVLWPLSSMSLVVTLLGTVGILPFFKRGLNGVLSLGLKVGACSTTLYTDLSYRQPLPYCLGSCVAGLKMLVLHDHVIPRSKRSPPLS